MQETKRINKNLLILLVAMVLATASILTFGVGKSGTSGGNVGSAGVDTIGKTLKIGLARINSGSSANYGKHADFGAEMAVEEINKSGRLGDVKIELVKEDTEGQADKAKTVIQKLVKQDNVAAIVGPQSSSEMMASGDITQESGIPMVSATATNPKSTDKGDSLFSVAYTDTYQGELLGKYIANSGKKKVAFLFNSDNPYSTGGKDAIKAKLLGLGVEVVAEEAFSKGATDFNGQLQRIKSAGADALVLPEEVGPITPIGSQARSILGKDIPFYGIDGMGGITGTAKGEDFDNSFYVNSFSGDAPTSEIQTFYKTFKEKYGEEPTFVSANTYDAIYVVADAYKYAINKTPEGLRNEIEKTNKSYVTGRISFSRQRFAIKPVMVIEIKKVDGKLVERYKETLSGE